jgi:hypothetical protein
LELESVRGCRRNENHVGAGPQIGAYGSNGLPQAAFRSIALDRPADPTARRNADPSRPVLIRDPNVNDDGPRRSSFAFGVRAAEIGG